MIIYTQYMSKPSHKKSKSSAKQIDPRVKFVAIPVLALISLGAIAFVVMTIANLPKPEGAMRGVGADGFRAYIEKDGDLGAGRVASKQAVAEALGQRAKQVNDVVTTTVFNMNGTRGQTATYDIVKANGKPASVYVDVTIFKNTIELEKAAIYANTGKTDPIGGHPAYYMHALTIGSDREYRLMVVNGAKVYKFVLVQPFRDITINEAGAVATLKKIAAKSQL